MENINEKLITEKKNNNGESRKHTTIEDKTVLNESDKTWIPFGRISWPAIFAGVLITGVSQLLLSLLGIGIGFSTIDPLTEKNPVEGLGTGTIVWWSLSMLISLYIGGLTTGRMLQTWSKAYNTWHGLLTWSAFTIFSFFMLTTGVGMLVSGAGNIAGTFITAGATGAAGAAGAAADEKVDISSIKRNATNLLRDVNNANDQNKGVSSQETNVRAQEEGVPNVNTGRQQGVGATAPNRSDFTEEVQEFLKDKNISKPEAKQALVKSLSRETGMSEAEASREVDKWIASYEKLKAEAKIKADQVSRAAARASIIAFFALLLGAIVTILGARSVSSRTKEFATTHTTSNTYSKKSTLP